MKNTWKTICTFSERICPSTSFFLSEIEIENLLPNFNSCPCLKLCFLLDFQWLQYMKPKYIPLYTYFIICFNLHLKRHLTFFSWILISVNGSRRVTVLDIELFSKKESRLEAHENMSIRCNCSLKETLSNWKTRTSTGHVDSLQNLIY